MHSQELEDFWSQIGDIGLGNDRYIEDENIHLFDYLEELEETGVEIEYDPIAFRCEYTQYDNLEEFWEDYDKEDYPDFEILESYTQIIRIDDTRFIIADF